MIDEQGKKWKQIYDPETIHLTSEKDMKLTYFADKDNLSTRTVNQAVVDNGCPTNVAGKPWVDLSAESRGIKKFKTERCSKTFKFGPSMTFESREKVIIPTKIGSKVRTLEVHTISSNLPLLLSNSELEKWKAIQNYENSTLTIDGEIIKLNKMESGHYGIDLGRTEEITNCYMVNEKFQKDINYQREEIKKLHRTMGHAGADKLIDLFKNKGSLTNRVRATINQTYSNCAVCRKYSKKQPRPKVGLPKASEANEVVSLDLKNVSSLIKKTDDKRYILYLTDEFSKFVKGVVIPNKESETIVKAIQNTWVFGTAGYPTRGFFADNGKEFVNEDIRALCRKMNLSIKHTPAYSPWSNGGNERRHASVDATIVKLKEDLPTTSLEELVN